MKPSKPNRFTVQRGNASISADFTGAPSKLGAKITVGMRPSDVQKNSDGSIDYSFSAWPSVEETERFGRLSASPITYEMSHYIGRIIVQTGVVESRVKALIRQLCQHNGTTLDWQHLSKYKQLVTRLKAEAGLIASLAPIGSRLIQDSAEATRFLHRSRGNLAHGEIQAAFGNGHICIVAKGKNGEEWFTEEDLQTLALQLCRESYALKAALDPEDHTALRSLTEKRFLRGFQASNPLHLPMTPTPPLRLQSLKP